MQNFSLTLYLEITNLSYFFFVGQSDEEENFKIIYKSELPLSGIENNRISDLEKVSEVIKNNVYIAEQTLNHTFKEIVLILENFDTTCINVSGFKKLNGSQILRENITYILNTLKSCLNETEVKKTILHIFNSKFYLEDKKITNLPIGLFGDFYSHELSFILMNLSDKKNLKNIFEKCNLNLKKILIKSYIKGVNLSDNYENKETFYQIQINEKNSKIFYFENNSLKFEQNFKFGTDIIINDISKVTFLKINTVKVILDKIDFKNNILGNELIKEKFLLDDTVKKIKKKLIYDIAAARIKEITEIMLFENINFFHYNKISNDVFFEINVKSQFKSLDEIYKRTFSMHGQHNLIMIKSLSNESMIKTANKLVHFGWKNEAIPILQSKKSIIERLFDTIFG